MACCFCNARSSKIPLVQNGRYLNHQVCFDHMIFNIDYDFVTTPDITTPNLLFQLACNKGKILILKYLKNVIGLLKQDISKEVCQEVVLFAATNGHEEVLEFLHSDFCFDTSDIRYGDTNKPLIEACKNGHLKVLKCFRNTYKLSNSDALDAFKYACLNGHLDMVKYLHVNFGMTKEILLGKDMLDALKCACSKGHLQIVKYLHTDIGVTEDNTSEAIKYACNASQAKITEYLQTIRFYVIWYRKNKVYINKGKLVQKKVVARLKPLTKTRLEFLRNNYEYFLKKIVKIKTSNG
jgi:hypothetical protein